MNKKDIAAIRRRLNPDSQNPIEIRGCYVNGSRAVVSTFHRPLIALAQGESEKYTQIFKRALSGDMGKNLTEIAFPVDQVMDGETHAHLMALNQNALKDDECADAFFARVIEGTQMEGNYLILLLHDTYDAPMRTNDELAREAESEVVFSYMLCAVCPVKQRKPELSYSAEANDFHSCEADWVVASPEMGFMFPAYEDGGPNISKALYYTRDTADCHADFIACALAAPEIIPADEQKEAFHALLKAALEDECSLEVAQTVNEKLLTRLEEQKHDKEAEPARVSKREVMGMLAECGVSDQRVSAFDQQFDEQFGLGMDLSAASLVNDKQFEVRTPDVVVRVSPQQAALIETRVIDGVKYILIRADEGVTVNGMEI